MEKVEKSFNQNYRLDMANVFATVWLVVKTVLASLLAFVRSVKSKQSAQETAEDLTEVAPEVQHVPESVNFHFTRQCNYQCGFCFHTAKTSFLLPIKEAKRGLEMLAKAGMKKINFSGGEPFLIQRGKYLGEMVRYCKEDLEIESVTVVTNGSKVTEEWMEEFGYFLDILAVSCDSFDHKVNDKIGRRSTAKNDHLESLKTVKNWCQAYGVLFKLNTVVNKYNFQEDMQEAVRKLDPVRWKVFQCLAIEAENMGEGAMRQVKPFLIEESEWQQFLDTHGSLACLVPESNLAMRNSYLILDEYMRFLDNTGGKKDPSHSILDVGVEAGMNKAGFDKEMFLRRGGKYVWSKQDRVLEW